MSGARWIPERLMEQDGERVCRWVNAAGIEYIEPFFDITLSRIRRLRPETLVTPLAEIRARASRLPQGEPAAVIFHVSRCGSTLFSQLLALDPRHAVLSEPSVLNALLTSAHGDRAELFADAVRLLGAGASRVFLKTDCWHVLQSDEMRRVFPSTPFVLMYREPGAVLASQARGRGTHMVPGQLAGTAIDQSFDPARMTLDGYGARVLAQMYRAMADTAARDGNTILVSYDEGMPAAFHRVARDLGWSLDSGAIDERCRYHGKQPGDAYAGDPQSGGASVDLAELETLHARLESMRAASGERA